jgi:oligosaccharyltransferase complex subunit beta
VVDHFNYDASSAAEKHDVLLLPPPGSYRSDVRDFFSAGAPADSVIAFPRGVGTVLGQGELLTPILRAPSTAYSYNPKEQTDSVSDDLFAAGAQLALVAAMQARNSARLTVVGSAEVLEDRWFDAKVKTAAGKDVKTFNREFAKGVSAWTFQELGVLRVNWIEHHLNEVGADNVSNPKIYRIKNDVVSADTEIFWRYLGTCVLITSRPTPSPSPSICGTHGPLSPSLPTTHCNSNFPCCRHSTDCH